MADEILLESGETLLLESGSSILLQSSTASENNMFLKINATDFLLINTTDKLIIEEGEAASGTGVNIQGTHGLADLGPTVDLRGIGGGRRRKREMLFTLEATGKVSHTTRLPVTGKLQTLSEFKAKGRMLTESTAKMISRLMLPNDVSAEGGFHSATEARLPQYREKLNENITYMKLRRIIKSYRRLMESFEDDDF